jgi:hypothetical protein
MSNTPSSQPHIALLLPLSDRLKEASEAVRDGFLSAYYQSGPDTRPALRIYDVLQDAAATYRQALAAGAIFVIGPLGKTQVAEVSAVADVRIPTLLLNSLPEQASRARHLYQFALSPEDEARQVAERLLAEGKRSGATLVPSGDWGQRVLSAFREAYQSGGGRLVVNRTFSADATDLSEATLDILNFEPSQHRRDALVAITGLPLQFTPRRRDEIEFIFFAGQPTPGRLTRQQLKFHYAADLPIYATSDVYEPSPMANQDLDGVMFVDMPWLISDEPSIASLRAGLAERWSSNNHERSRLFALGLDIWPLTQRLLSANDHLTDSMLGVTGRLTMDSNGRIHRRLEWAVVQIDGTIRAMPAAPGTL